jgi:hypothetical protein
MQGSYRSARIVKTLNLFIGRLWDRVRAVEQEDRDLLVGLLADIHRPMNAGPRLLPLDLTRVTSTRWLSSPSRYSDRKSPLSHCDSMEGIAMPPQSLAGSKAQTANHRGSVMKHDFVCHDSSRQGRAYAAAVAIGLPCICCKALA